MLKDIKAFNPKRHRGSVNSIPLYLMLESVLPEIPGTSESSEFVDIVSVEDRSDEYWAPPLATRGSRLPALRGTASFRGFQRNDVTGREAGFESTIERDLADINAANRDVVDIEDQPETLNYKDADGVVHKHTFDLRVTWSDGRRIAYACKAEARRQASGIDLIVEQISKQHPEFADSFEVVTRRNVSRLDASNARTILHSRRLRSEHDVAHLSSLLEQIHGWVRFDTLAALHGHADQTLVAVVNLIDDGKLAWGGDDRIGPDMAVCVK